ncbi:hypothetical protein SBA7_170005 [Candidatus Sulfotelmatobacter sp. SbA7]|nr:hypothetical protein SBA7_170005 [Candidatus Sulfotelmatobacter sp. SbA7]
MLQSEETKEIPCGNDTLLLLDVVAKRRVAGFSGTLCALGAVFAYFAVKSF